MLGEYKFSGDDKVIIIAHWDVDGLSSIAKFKKYISPDADYYIPPIGMYSIPRKDFKFLKDHDILIILDIALQDKHIGELKNYLDIPVYVIDHHHHPRRENGIYFDPLMEDGSRFPSNTLLIDYLLRLKHDFITLLGIVGDIGMKIRNLNIMDEFYPILSRYGLDLKDIYKMTLLIDSNHIVNDMPAVYKAVEKIIKYQDDPKLFLEDEEWNRNYILVEKEINKWVVESSAEHIRNIVFLKINSGYYIISRIGRRISDKNPNKVTVIVNTGFFRDFDQIYIRTNNYPINITEVIEYSVSKGYTAGGKDDVMGIIIPKTDTESFLNHIFHSWYGKPPM